MAAEFGGKVIGVLDGDTIDRSIMAGNPSSFPSAAYAHINAKGNLGNGTVRGFEAKAMAGKKTTRTISIMAQWKGLRYTLSASGNSIGGCLNTNE